VSSDVLLNEAKAIIHTYGLATSASVFAQKVINYIEESEGIKINSSVLEYLNDYFPAPFYLKTNKYEVGTVLYTAKPYIRTNATIVNIKGNTFIILTDIGNLIEVDVKTLESNYLPPVCKRARSVPDLEEEYFTLL
jgi:hypothetical protein